MQDPRSYFELLADQSDAALRHSKNRERLISRLRLLVAVLAIPAVYFAFTRQSLIYWLPPAGAVILFIGLVRAATRQERQSAAHESRLKIAHAELQALSGDNSAFYSGAAHIDVSHPYTFDLDIFGPRSIYQMLARVVTLNGATLLASRLQAPDVDRDRICSRQDAIRELAALPDFCTGFRVTGNLSNEAPGELQQLQEWLEADDEFQNRAPLRLAATILPVAVVIAGAFSIWQEATHPAFTLLLAINTVLWSAFLKRIKYNNRRIGRNAAIVSKYADLFARIAGGGFRTAELARISTRAGDGLAQLQVFNKLVHRFDSRNNGMAGSLMNILFLHDFRCLIRLEAWRSKNRGLMQEALADISEFDLLNALGSYAFNHPDYNYPAIAATGAAMEAGDMRHPLLPADIAVGNSFSIGANEQLYLLTGANMTGKSTFIRTVGVSLILAQLGLPLATASATMPLLRVYTSIRVTDSVQEDVSYFKAELQRIRALFDTVSGDSHGYLVLIDEPLRGTNSGDKQEGTEAIIRRLLQEGVTGIVATHDTALCRLESASSGKVRNYHFESQVDNGTLHFDFRLKAGCSASANASLLMRQMGITG